MANIFYNEHPLVVNPALAKLVGLNEAIILQQLHYWISKNINIRDGKSWVYNTIKEWAEQFPFWNERTIRRVLDKLIKDGIVLAGNYNEKSFDRTKWYSIDYDAIRKLANAFTETDKCNRTECPNGLGQSVQKDVDRMSYTIPETTIDYTETSSYIGGDTPKRLSPKPKQDLHSTISEYSDNSDLQEALTAFVAMRKDIKKPLSAYSMNLALNKLSKLSDDEKEKTQIVNQAVEHCWQSFYKLKTSQNEGVLGGAFKAGMAAFLESDDD